MFAKEKRCPKCGSSFDCGGLFGCWCWRVKLDKTARTTLRDNYTDCLCPACLAETAAKSAITDPSVTGS
jgi:hypothetical protein